MCTYSGKCLVCNVSVCPRLSLDASGGQCLNDAGARIRRWSWRGHSQTPTPLRPVFLSLNCSLGVRALGQENMFVSFLSAGQQAKFSVGACLQVSIRQLTLTNVLIHIHLSTPTHILLDVFGGL